ncbi:hypothetical protein SD71_00005 [Cohnella kolymensis]|uniref:Uncharacterized protein n=1 Tax=Cohnella kolymensis TaxID=1590652 RepID=A0ABR5A7Z1_9BACL|nr:hypothetical protein [Cohnella kolymensis]KIL37170.1 hypothetical protein SD71_00005 [Cohnella kolymensis]
MDMQFLRASFETQEAAESAVRKLSSLRSDGIRLERLSSNALADQDTDALTATVMSGNDIQMYSGAMAAADVPSQEWRVSRGGEQAAGSAPFALSVNVPGSVAEQARNVIQAAGGQMS